MLLSVFVGNDVGDNSLELQLGGRRELARTFPTAQLKGIADRAGAPLLDLVPPFRDADKAGLAPRYYESDQHWTAAGHAVAAQAIAQFIRSEGLVPVS